jgi:3-hydroxyisobutyrate dehydrogenase
MATVAFIGLGNMGGPMAANLVNAGMTVTVFDLNPVAVEALTAQGALSAKTACGAAAAADFVITMLPAGKHVRSLYLGDDNNKGLLDVVSKQALLIDCAAAGTLTFICGGSEAAYQQAQTVLTVMGGNIFHAGAVGAGQIAKICNNMLLSVLMVGTSESLQLGLDNGLDPKVLSDIMKVSSGGNWTLEKYNPCPDVMENVPSSKDYHGRRDFSSIFEQFSKKK